MMTRLYEMAVGFLATTFGVAVAILWAIGGPGGAIWAAINDDLLSVVLSIFIPFYGAWYALDHLFG